MDDLPSFKANPMGEYGVEIRNDCEKVSVEEREVESNAPVLEEISTLELNNQNGYEIESEDDEDIEVVWEDEEPKQGTILNPFCNTNLENLSAQILVKTTCDSCEDDSLWEDDSIAISSENLTSEEDNMSFYSCENGFEECATSNWEDEVIIEIEKEDNMLTKNVVTFDTFTKRELNERTLVGV